MSGLGNKEIFANNLRYYMDLNQKSRNQLCSDLGLKYSTVSEWLNTNKYPRIDKIEILADYFNIQKSDLIEDKEKSTPSLDEQLEGINFALYKEAEELSDADKRDVINFIQFMKQKKQNEK